MCLVISLQFVTSTLSTGIGKGSDESKGASKQRDKARVSTEDLSLFSFIQDLTGL